MKERLLRLLNLKASESKYVFDLLSIQLFIGIANSLINIAALTLFIHHFSARDIAWGFLAAAVVLTTLNIGYERVEKKLSPLHLLRMVVIVSIFVLMGFWLGMLTFQGGVMIFPLLILTTVFYMITGYGYWGVVSLLFNIRESRRVFSIIGAGDIPAKLIGYAAAALLVPIIGLENLLLFSVGSLVVAFVLLNQLIRKKRWERIIHRAHVKQHHHKTNGEPLSLVRFFFQHRLIFTISLLSILSYNVFNLIDFTFITQIKARIQDISTLSTYIAVFFAIGRLVAFGLKIIFTSRVIERLGVINCLLITPTVLFLTGIAFIFLNTPENSLYIIGFMAMITEVLRSAMQEPVFFILFQPLNEHHRLRGHIIAKGYMLPPSLLIVGATLILLQRFHIAISMPLTIGILLVNLVIWGVVIHYIKDAYLKALHQSIARGLFTGDLLNTTNKTVVDLLLQKVASGKASERIYALTLLEKSSYGAIDDLLQTEVRSGTTETKQFALSLLSERKKLSVSLLQQWINDEENTEIKHAMILRLCEMHQPSLFHFTKKLSVFTEQLRKKFVCLLLNQTEFELLHRGVQEISRLLQSAAPSDREFALDIIGELTSIRFTSAIQHLIDDGNNAVKRSATIAACKMRNKPLLPFLFERLGDPAEKYIVIQGLIQYGDNLFEDINGLNRGLLDNHKAELVKIAAKVKGPLSTQFLLDELKEKNSLEEKIIHILWARSFRAELPSDMFLFQELLKTYIERGLEKMHYHTSLPVFEASDLIKHSLTSEIWNDLTSALKVATIIYSKNEVSRVVELIENKDRQKLFNAMEMLEMVLPKRTARQINVLFDYILEPNPARKKETETGTNLYLQKILSPGSSFNHWTKAICLYTSLKNKKVDLLRSLPAQPERYENIVLTETRSYVMTSLQSLVHADY